MRSFHVFTFKRPLARKQIDSTLRDLINFRIEGFAVTDTEFSILVSFEVNR